MHSANHISIWLLDEHSPTLEKVQFHSLLLGKTIVSVRGKSGSGRGTGSSFQWTSAVQALTILLLKGASNSNFVETESDSFTPDLCGERGSIVTSLDYALDKQPTWLLDMFGTDSNGTSILRRLVHRHNPGGKRPGSIYISVNRQSLSRENIKVYLNNNQVTKLDELEFITRTVEKACGAVQINEPENKKTRQNGNNSKRVIPITQDQTERVTIDESCTKTPFVIEDCPEGKVFSRVYESKYGIALVTAFRDPETINREKPVSIRIHSSCINSDVLDSRDCDCREQLVQARSKFHREGGIMIHLSQEGRGAGLSTKFRGMALMQRSNISTFQAYNSLSVEADQRNYDLVGLILEDLAISRVQLLTNNPSKVGALQKLGLTVTREPLLVPLSPTNFSYLFSKWIEGAHEFSSLFDSDIDPLFAQNFNQNKKYSKIWLIGGDDILWADNILYEDIIRQFTDHIVEYITDASRAEIRSILDSVEDENLKVYGYGPSGFQKSLEKTFQLLSKQYRVNIPPPSELYDRIFSILTNSARDVDSHSKEVLTSLRERGDGLILLTQGPLHIQANKIARSGLCQLFDAILITKETQVSTFQFIQNKLGHLTSTICVVGNNLKSEIEPAVKLGVKAFYFRNPNCWQLLNKVNLDKTLYTTVTSLPQLLQH